MLNLQQTKVYVAQIIPVKYAAPRGTAKNFIPSRCLFLGCSCNAQFKAWSDYSDHLGKQHGVALENRLDYYPTTSTALQRRRL